MPLRLISLLPPICVLGNLPFFFIMTLIASKATHVATINNVNSKVLNISINFVVFWAKKGYSSIGAVKIVLFILTIFSEIPKKSKNRWRKRGINKILQKVDIILTDLNILVWKRFICNPNHSSGIS
jgi:hypothetical protein